MKVKMEGISHIGNVRKNNEDSIFYEENLGVCVVCDGIGGREGGEVASQTATEVLKEEFEACDFKQRGVKDFLLESGDKINAEIIKKGQKDLRLSGMGTTMECLIFKDDQLHIGHIGDSRTYLYFDNQLWLLTVDHNVKTLIQYGDLPKEVSNHANDSSLMRALGVQSEIEMDLYDFKLKKGQIFLSSSDGLFDMVEDQDILKIMQTYGQDIKTLAEELIQSARDSGGADNVSLVLTHVL